MLLTNLLRPALIKPHLEAESRREAIGEVLDLLVQDHEVPYAQRNSVFEEILEREHEMGSGMEAGLAIPHATTDRVEDLLCAFGTAPNGIPFDAIDDAPCKAVLLMLIPRSAYDERIHTLETAAEVFGQRGIMELLCNAKDSQEVYEVIKQAEQRIRR